MFESLKVQTSKSKVMIPTSYKASVGQVSGLNTCEFRKSMKNTGKITLQILNEAIAIISNRKGTETSDETNCN